MKAAGSAVWVNGCSPSLTRSTVLPGAGVLPQRYALMMGYTDTPPPEVLVMGERDDLEDWEMEAL